MRLGGMGVCGRLALTASAFVFLAAVAVVPAGNGGEVRMVAVVAFVHGVRLVKLMV